MRRNCWLPMRVSAWLGVSLPACFPSSSCPAQLINVFSLL